MWRGRSRSRVRKRVGSPVTSTRQWWAPQPTGRCSTASARSSHSARTRSRISSSVTSGRSLEHRADRGTACLGGWGHARTTSTSPPRCARRCSPPTSPTTGWPRRSARTRTARSVATRPSPRCGVRRRARPLDTLVRLFLLQTPVDARRRRAGAARPGRPALQRRAARAERQRGRRAAGLPSLRHRGPRPLGRLRPDPGPGRRPGRRRRRPRARHLERLDEPGPAHHARAGRPRPRPRHRLRRAGAAPRRRTPAASSPPTSTPARCG